MYDLNKAIDIWKSMFVQNEACGHEDAQELEYHLREQIGMLVETGLSEKEAFLVAESRLGDPTQICSQFAQADPSTVWQNRFFWMAAGMFLWLVCGWVQSVLAGITAGTIVLLGISSGTLLGITSAVARLLPLLALVWFYKRGVPALWLSKLASFTATSRRRLLTIGLVLTAGLGKMFALLPVSFAMKTALINDETATSYTHVRMIGGVFEMILYITLIAFLILQAGRRAESVKYADS